MKLATQYILAVDAFMMALLMDDEDASFSSAARPSAEVLSFAVTDKLSNHFGPLRQTSDSQQK
jgi:hypothetical protein